MSSERNLKVKQNTHLVCLPGSDHAVWRWVGLRGAGFPVQGVLSLANTACADLADDLLTTEARGLDLQDALLAALVELHQHTVAARKADADDTVREQHKQAVRDLKKLHKRVKQAKPIDASRLPIRLHDLTAQYNQLLIQMEQMQQQYEVAFAAATLHNAQAIRDVAGDPNFQEAFLWQNRPAFQRTVQALLNTPITNRSYKMRKREELIVSYWQRYCVKNDSVGFFGPIGWATIDERGDAFQMTPGPNLVKSHTTFFEDWAIDALAKAASTNEQLWGWLCPRLYPHLYLDGNMLLGPTGQTISLSTVEAFVAAACDGQTPAREIARRAASALPTPHHNDAIYAILREFANAGRINWTLEFPNDTLHPEQALRQRLMQMSSAGEPPHTVLDALDQLDDARQRVAQLSRAETIDDLNSAFVALEQTFVQLTAQAASQQQHHGRLVVYQDCQRDVAIHMGQTVLQALGPSLSLLLTSARWFTHAVAQRYQQIFEQQFWHIFQQHGCLHDAQPAVSMADFWLWVQPTMFGDGPLPIDEITQQLQAKWAKLLSLDEAVGPQTVHADALQASVATEFAAPGPGWPSACYYSPDILLAAPSVEQINAGTYQFVLGELHLGNTLSNGLFVSQHPEPQQLFRASELDLPKPRVIPVSSRAWNDRSMRTRFVLTTPKDIQLLIAHDACPSSAGVAYRLGQFVVVHEAGNLVVCSRDGKLRFEIVEFFAEFFAYMTVHAFDIFPKREHLPRICIDQLVINRETWRFSLDTLAFPFEETRQEQFLSARDWRMAAGLPRFVFVKLPTEAKPVYADFDSLAFVNLLSRLIRKAVENDSAELWMTVTEMLPAHDQNWLTDAQKRTYTSEFRIVTVDNKAWRAKT